MSVTGSIMAGVGLAGSIGGAAISSNAAGNAASTQANAADTAAQLQYQSSQNALGFQENEYNQAQANEAPWLSAGANGLSNLQYLLGVGPNPGQSPQGSGGQSPIPGSPGQIPGGPSQPTGATPQVSQGQTAGPGNYGRPTAGAVGATGSLNNLNGIMNSGGQSQVVQGPTATLPAQGATPQPISAGMTRPLGGPQMPAGSPTPAPSIPGAPPGVVPQGTVNPSLGGYGSLMQAYPGGQFQAPTAAQALQSPGEQAQLQLGEQALQQSAAAQGNLLTGGTAQALDAYGQNLASTNYQNTYNNAYNSYASNYNQYQQQQTNEYNRLASLAGVGQQTASTLGTLGQNAATGVTNNLLSTGQSIGQNINNAGAANASGIVGSANAYGGALSNTGSNISNLLLLNQLQGTSQGAQDANTANGLGLAVGP